MSNTAGQGFRTRLEVLFARAAPKAVVLRRGPKRHFHLVAWDLAENRFEHGQWMKGHVRLCDLSPSGDKLLYWAHQYHAAARWRDPGGAREQGPYDPLAPSQRRRSPKRGEGRRRTPRYLRDVGMAGKGPMRRNLGVWTAISRPPFFTALAIWPSDGHWTGGGLFLSEEEIALGETVEGLRPKENAPWPKQMRLVTIDQARRRADWPPQRPAMGWEPGEDADALYQGLARGLRAGGARWIEFIQPLDGGDLVFGCDGRIHRLADWRAVAPEACLAASDPLLDLAPMRFAPVAPPEHARRW